MNDLLIHCAVAYLLMGILWVLHNTGSRLAREDRARWRRERKYLNFVLVPFLVALLWPLCALLVLKIRKAMKSGEFDRVARKIAEEEKKKHQEPKS